MKTEAELITKIKNGEWRNYAILVDKYEAKVFNYTLYVLGKREDAEEVVQDTFVKAFRSLDSFRGESTFSTWLIRIAHFTSLTRLRKKSATHVEIDKANQIINEEDDPSKDIQLNDKREILKYALSQLKDNERSLVTLYYYQDCSIKEIEEITELTQANIKVTLHRARKKLLEILNTLGIKENTL